MLIETRFSDILSDSSIMLPGAAYERDPTVNYDFHKSALYTMATCHSLHQVEGELLGDPLDVKMFEFTGWSFEESGHTITGAHHEELTDVPSAVARPSAGMEFGIGGTYESRPVCQDCLSNATAAPLNQSLDISNRVGNLEDVRVCITAPPCERCRSILRRYWRGYIRQRCT